MLYNTHIATRPTKPCAEKPATMLCMLAIILMLGQNGMFCPLNKTSSTMPNESKLMPASVNAPAQAFTLLRMSIKDLLSFLKLSNNLT